MRRPILLPIFLIAAGPAAFARHSSAADCGTTRETANETMFLHRQAARARTLRPRVAGPLIANQDIGDIAIVQDANGVVDRLNQFNLDGNTLTFTPTGAAQYRYSVATNGVPDSATRAGTSLAALDDDDSRLVSLPFPFPFYGATYSEVYVNSDGNLTFGTADSASTERSLGRMAAGPPRIAPLFDDLNPGLTAGGVSMSSEPTAFVVSWTRVPEYSDTRNGDFTLVPTQSFQVWLYPDGRIQFSYAGANPSSAVVGISPGGLKGPTSIVDFRSDASAVYGSTLAEVFANTVAVDMITVAQQFYQTHEDSYDYLVVYNNLDIPAKAGGVIAYEQTVRNSATGFGFPAVDFGAQFGSASRLQAALNLGPLSQYPANPNALVPARALQADTPLTILAHETGHRFLAYASVRDANDATALPMLGYQNAHWSFLFNSEASVDEGERIADGGAAASPRFVTTDLTQGYSPLDQYLMGLRAPAEVPGAFLVENPTPNFAAATHPFSGISFNGTRREIGVADVIATEGRRTPDYTVAQRRFRFAFILVVAPGTTPSASELAEVDTWRRQFEAFFGTASSNRASADTSLKRSLKLSLYPSAGVVQGGTVNATLTVATPPQSDMAIQLAAPNANAHVPTSVKLAAGATSVTFPLAGLRPGVEDVVAAPSDTSYETAFARVQVADAAALKLTAELTPGPGTAWFSAPPTVTARLSDANGLPYAGVGVIAIPSIDGAVVPSEAFTDPQGRATFHWNPGPSAVNRLQLTVDGMPAVLATVSAGSAVPAITSVVNAASFEPGIAAGSLATIFGNALGGAKVLLNGAPLKILSAADVQINVYIPPDAPLGTGTFTAVTASGATAIAAADIVAVAPGIFLNGVRAVGGGPIRAGGFIEIYCTGLGATRASGTLDQTASTPTVFIGATPVRPSFSGLAPGLTGVYQIDVQVPANAAGLQSLMISIDNAHSNQTAIAIQ
jgi:uncharacterized protein (TIGR03437 family)